MFSVGPDTYALSKCQLACSHHQHCISIVKLYGTESEPWKPAVVSDELNFIMAETSKNLYPLLLDLKEGKRINFYYALDLLRGGFISISSSSSINKIYILLIKATTFLSPQFPPPKKNIEKLLFNKILPVLQITRSVETRYSPHKLSIIKHMMASHFTF